MLTQAECEGTGGHEWHGLPLRLPVTDLSAAAVMAPPDENPVPLKYWAIHKCMRCGYEIETPHGFTPRRS
jgi:hypothetical protein